MKTAMQELKEALEIDSRYNKGTRVGKAIDIILSAFPKLLEAEKEQMKNSYCAGAMDLLNSNKKLVYQIEKLEADKKELLALMVTMKDSFDNKAWVTSMELQSFSKQIESLIQKHKQ